MSKRKLLLADDSITIQKVVNLTFADEGIEVFTFGDGDAAFENLAAVNPDIVLADVNMPGLSGYQLCESVRGNEETKDVPVILLVGSFEPFDQGEAERVGANGHLTKPFSSIAELIATVKGLLDSTVSGDGEISQIEPKLEPEREPEPERSASDDDIESLYRQSFVETMEMPHGDAPVTEFGDDGVDDEMIQTSYAGSDADTVTDAGFFEDEADDLNVDQEPSPVAADQSDTAPTEYVLSDSQEADAEPGTVVDDRETSDTSNGSFEQADSRSFEDAETEQKSASFQFDEVDLLELPAIPNGKSYKFATAEQAVEAGSREQIVSLSPELIDIIVQKVVEKLAEKY